MAKLKKIKLAVVGITSTGKSHFITDVLEALTHKRIGIDPKDPNHDSNYARAYSYIIRQEELKKITFTDPNALLTRTKDHFKGTSKGGKFILEFMDIPGEAFRTASRINAFTDLKNEVEKHYTIPWHKRIIKNTPSPNSFVEEHWTDGDAKIIKIRLNNQEEETTQEETTQGITPRDSEVSETVSKPDKPTTYRLTGTYYRTGKYVVKHFEKYDTESLIKTLKYIVETQQTDINNNHRLDLIYKDQSFWNHFYAYVFCDTCTDIVFCDLLAVHMPKSETASNSEAQDTPNSEAASNSKAQDTSKPETDQEPATFRNCIDGCNIFTRGRNNKKYLIFRGMDALLEQSGENNNILHQLFNNIGTQDYVQLAPYIYFLIHLAIYDKYLRNLIGNNNVTQFLKDLANPNNRTRFISKLRHLLKDSSANNANPSLKDIKINLKYILQDEEKFFVPKIGNESTLSIKLTNRINAFFIVAPYIRNCNSGIVPGITTNCIHPHIYFTAHPIDRTTLKIYKNEMGSASFSLYNDKKEDFIKENRFPLGVYNFVADMLYQHGIGDYCEGTDMEMLLYYKES
jgi:hypothetical protein